MVGQQQKVPSGVTVEGVVRGCEPFDGYFVAARMDMDVCVLQLFYPRPPCLHLVTLFCNPMEIFGMIPDDWRV